jgi:hypothetical protein
VLGDLFYQLGTLVGDLSSHLPGKAGAEPEASPFDQPTATAGAALYDPVTGGITDLADGEVHDHLPLLVGAATTWLVARVFRPRPVSWPRVILAGVAGTLLADLATRTLEPGEGERGPFEDEPEVLLKRYAYGVAMAAGYAALVYPRLPGSPMTRGLAFGAIDAAVAERGGLAALATEVRSLQFPLQGLLSEPDAAPGALGRMAFGVGLGLFYRHDEEMEEVEDYEE